MLSKPARFLLILTSLTPVVSIILAIEISNRDCGFVNKSLLTQLAMAAVLFFIFIGIGYVVCRFILKRASNVGNEYPLSVLDYEKSDDKIITFLLIFLLPFLRSFNPAGAFQLVLLTVIYVVVIIFMVKAEAYQYNICAYLCGYRFYTIKNENNVKNLLVAKSSNSLMRVNRNIQTRRISDNVYIEV